MGTEIERKFLVNKTRWAKAHKGEGVLYRQGYITTEPERTIRVRLAGNSAYLTIKGITVKAARKEYEYTIPVTDAEELLDNFSVSSLSKIRYDIKHNQKLWQVDEFLGDNTGLILAEIELVNEYEEFDAPEWLGKEVTEDPKYFNSNLSLMPYKDWR